jgi:hypothetical protein
VVTSAAELQNKVMTQRAKGLHPSPCNGRHIVAHCASRGIPMAQEFPQSREETKATGTVKWICMVISLPP